MKTYHKRTMCNHTVVLEQFLLPPPLSVHFNIQKYLKCKLTQAAHTHIGHIYRVRLSCQKQ